MKHVTKLLASFLCISLAVAQQTNTPPSSIKQTVPEQPAPTNDPRPSRDPVLDGQIQRMREQMVSGRQVRSHVRVTIRLKNGNRIRGVVKDGRLVERDDGLRFVQAEAQEAGAGIRLWYFDRSSSYVFLPFEAIQNYSVQERLTTEQVLAIETQLREDEQRRAELDKLKQGKGTDGQDGQPPAGTPPNGDAAQPPPAADAGSATPPATTPPGTPAEGKLSTDQQKAFALLQEFPPQGGWSAQRRDEIARKMPVLHIPPTDVEKRFLEVFADWQKACDAFGIKPTPPADGQGDSGSSTDSRRRSSKKK